MVDPSGLIYMRARWYDPVTARFITRDRLAESSSSTSPYAYAADNPMLFVDPTGLRISAGSDNDGGRCTLACVGVGTLIAAAAKPVTDAVSDAAFGSDATFAHGPEGVTIVQNATGIFDGLVSPLGAGGDNNVTFGSSLIVSNTTLGSDPAADDTLRHEYGHVQQARALGPLYLPTYVVLTVPAALDWLALSAGGGLNVTPHDWHVMEVMANAYAKLPLFPSFRWSNTRW